MYKIIFEIDIEKTLRRIPKKDAQSIIEKIEELSKNPRPRWIEKMKSRPGYRIASGNYRIIYTVDDKNVIVYVVDVDNRKSIYKNK